MLASGAARRCTALKRLHGGQLMLANGVQSGLAHAMACSKTKDDCLLALRSYILSLFKYSGTCLVSSWLARARLMPDLIRVRRSERGSDLSYSRWASASSLEGRTPYSNLGAARPTPECVASNHTLLCSGVTRFSTLKTVILGLPIEQQCEPA